MWSHIIMLEDLFWKKPQEKIAEAASLYEFVDSESTRDKSFVPLNSYKTLYMDSPEWSVSTINPRSILRIRESQSAMEWSKVWNKGATN